MKFVLAAVALLIGAFVAAALAGASSWHRATRATVATLAPASPEPAMFDAASIEQLPRPVANYFRTAITNGHPIVRAAIATQQAEFYVNGGWRPLTATQHFTASPPAFVWDARIVMAPILPAMVRDSYVDGRAAMQASLYGAYTIVNQIDKPELNAGALQRFLGEAVWFPTALLPSSTLSWQPRDDRSASVTLTDGAASATLLFEFGDDGMPATISGDRYKEGGGHYTMQPWQIRCDQTAVQDGLSIPMRCEVAWINNGARESYWRGRITSINYEYDRIE